MGGWGRNPGETRGTRTEAGGCQASCNVAGPLLSIISCPPTARIPPGGGEGRPAADFGRIHFGTG
jgi:hypothetical protein